MAAYYNENDPYAAEWLRNLIAAGHIAPGDVDERSIIDVRPDDLKGYTQCHFFAGIGVWSYALRLAGWPDNRPVWTGSCPCPPFSSAGKGQQCPDCGSKRNLCHPRRTGYFICLDCGCNRHADARHLWPEFSRLIRECRPPVVFGEQVASADGRLWLDVVSADLQHASYGVAGADLCAAGFGAPHIRQRLYWVAYDYDARLEGWKRAEERAAERPARAGGMADGMADAKSVECELIGGGCEKGGRREVSVGKRRSSSGMADAEGERRNGRESSPWAARRDCFEDSGDIGRPRPTNGFWRAADWLFCRDGKWRPVEPGTFPLAHGATARVGRLRAYGNAIVPQVAAEVIGAYLDGEWLL